MACEGCRSQARTLLRTAIRASAATRAPAATKFLRVAAQPATIQTAATIRSFGTTSSRSILGSSFRDAYRVVGESEKLYKACAKPADYRITEDERKNDDVQRLEDGEEVGHSLNKDNVWHSSMYLLDTCAPSYIMMRITTNFYSIQAATDVQHMVACDNASPLPRQRPNSLLRPRGIPQLATAND